MNIIRYTIFFFLTLFSLVPASAQTESEWNGGDDTALSYALSPSAVTIQANGRQVRITGAEHQTMQVFSMTGRKVAEYAIDANDKTVTLNVPRGWYAVRIGNEVARKIYVP